jgi:hypothetical protein
LLARSPAPLEPPGLLARLHRPWPPLGQSSPELARACPRTAEACPRPRLAAAPGPRLIRARPRPWPRLARAWSCPPMAGRSSPTPCWSSRSGSMRRRRATRVDVGQARTPPSSRAQRRGQRRRSGTEAGGMRSRGGRRRGAVEGRVRSKGVRGLEQGRSGPQQGTAAAGVGEGGRRRSVDSVGGQSR